MSQPMPWYPLYHADFISDTQAWNAATVGCLIRLMNHQWANGSVPNNQTQLAAICGVSIAVWAPIWAVLRPKFVTHTRGTMVNKRLAIEYERQTKKRKQAQSAVRVRWDKEKEKKQLDTDVDTDTIPEAFHLQSQSTDDPPLPSGAAPHGKKKTQLPEDWQPDNRLLYWASTKHPKVDVPRQTELFKDHAQATGRVMKDWRAAWRMWIGKSRDFGGGSHEQLSPTERVTKATGIDPL